MLSQKPPDLDASIRLTDTDAALARLSAVQKQYLSDPFIKALVPRAQFQPARPPLINVGTFVRTVAIDDLVQQWLDIGKKCQIVSLGAGSDTRYWRLATGPYKDSLSAYIEVDFAENTMKKAMAIRKSKELNAVLGSDVKLAQGGTALHSPIYHLLPADLRDPPSVALKPLAELGNTGKPILDPSLPTLLLFECVLCYMSPEASNTLLRWFSEYTSSVLGTMVYEMFGLEDSFGRVMVNNLKARNVTLPGAEPYPTLASLPNRFLTLGYTAAHALTLKDIRRQYINPQELERISKLEFLDEVEELDLVLDHYAITWGVLLPSPDSLSWRNWGLKQKQREEEEY
ncbi:leucine carboxyl methyltransferase [Moniliophthora roreri MCA 2997]|uniref:Leucine carboxyl methyltransferase 1 n=1 Tax=Moniliophthora roreri (strain MCA 2997) TaxID=1381753 RepID=V2Z075_MONRO|nr:leucine carboxyl methyltransferase [Moniliophthora roreri MCA 2997]